jgi:predicted phage terminase large subunit-like protein
LGVRTNLRLQRIIDGPKYQRVFPHTRLSLTNTVREGVGRYARNSSLLEYVGQRGFFRNTTVEGQITGQGLDMGLVDDPMKGRAEAQSKHQRDKVWNWLMDDFFTRFSEMAGMIFTMTRWHIDDPIARFIERFPNAVIISFPAIAAHDELYRRKGEALFPEHKSLEFLLERKHGMSQASWESLYQQNPIIVGGGMFPIEKFRFINRPPDKQHVKRSVRYWDKAGTADGGAYTAGVLMHELVDGSGFVISDVRRGQWSSFDRETRIRQQAAMDNAIWGRVDIWVEQEPGSGGKESAERTILNLKGFVAKADKVTGAKELRADPYAAQMQQGNIILVSADWNQAFVDEHEAFPNSKTKDQVDAAGAAFVKVTEKRGYDTSLSWVR